MLVVEAGQAAESFITFILFFVTIFHQSIVDLQLQCSFTLVVTVIVTLVITHIEILF